MRRSLTALALVAGALALSAPPAVAAPPQPFSIHESIDFENGVFDFTSSSPLCPSGSFEDEVVNVRAFQSERRVNVTIDTVFTCDDGSGTFSMRKHVNILFDDVANPSSGPVTLTGGTGAYEGLAGHGVDIGLTDNESGIGTGEITGLLVHP